MLISTSSNVQLEGDSMKTCLRVIDAFSVVVWAQHDLASVPLWKVNPKSCSVSAGGVTDELHRKQDRDARRSRAGVRRAACLERNHGARVEDRRVDTSVQKHESRRERVWV